MKSAHKSTDTHSGTIRVLEANLDDMNPQIFGYFLEKALAAGALDVFATPVQMKKNRPGTLVTVLCKPEDEAKFQEMLFAETTTLGVRSHPANVALAARVGETCPRAFGEVRMKLVAYRQAASSMLRPEFDDCRKLAEEQNVPLQQVMEQAMHRFEEQYKK